MDAKTSKVAGAPGVQETPHLQIVRVESKVILDKARDEKVAVAVTRLQAKIHGYARSPASFFFDTGGKDVLGRHLDRPFSRQFHVVERDSGLQGHGALRRGRGRGDRQDLRAARRARHERPRRVVAGMVLDGGEEREASRRRRGRRPRLHRE